MDPKLRQAIVEAVTRISDKRTDDVGRLLGQLRGLARETNVKKLTAR